VAGCPSVVVLNKWDLVATEDREDVLAGVGDRLAFLGEAPVLRISAKSGRGRAQGPPGGARGGGGVSHPHPNGRPQPCPARPAGETPGPAARIRYGVQGAADPPTFTLFATARMSADYLRYVEHQIRERFDLGPTPIKLRVRIGGR